MAFSFTTGMCEKRVPGDKGLQVPIHPLTIAEVAAVANTRIKKEVWDYYECGADNQTALRENEAAFKA